MIIKKSWSKPNGEICICGIFVEYSHEYFPEYLEKVPYEVSGNIPNKCSGNIEYSNNG